jgi:hypothetical protein
LITGAQFHDGITNPATATTTKKKSIWFCFAVSCMPCQDPLRKEQFVALSASIPFVSCTENSQALAQNFLLSTRPHDEWRFSFHDICFVSASGNSILVSAEIRRLKGNMLIVARCQWPQTDA